MKFGKRFWFVGAPRKLALEEGMSKRLNPPGVLPVTEIIKNAESVLQNLSAQLD